MAGRPGGPAGRWESCLSLGRPSVTSMQLRYHAATMHLVERFAGFAEALRGKPLSPEVAHHARRAVIDWHAALYAGSVMSPATLLEDSFSFDLDRGTSFLAKGRK